MKQKDLVGIPWLLAFALRADGWYLRCHMPWVKRSAMPESCTDRPAKAIEDMFLFSKKPKYYFDMEAIKLKAAYAGKGRGGSTNRYEQNAAGMDDKEYATRNFRNADLWFQSIDSPHGMVVCNGEMVGLDVNPEAYSGCHFATFPPKLIEPCIQAGTSEKGVCPGCGMPWERVVSEPKGGTTGKSWQPHVDDSRGDKTRKLSGSEYNKQASSKTTGWRPACECYRADYLREFPAPPFAANMGDTWDRWVRTLAVPPEHQWPTIPATVFDPFFGAGTTGLVAESLGRNWLGIELNGAYARQAEDRIAQARNPETWTQADVPADAPLFQETD